MAMDSSSLRLHPLRMERIAFFSWLCGLVTSEPSSILNLDNPSIAVDINYNIESYNRFSKRYKEYILKTCFITAIKVCTSLTQVKYCKYSTNT